MEEGLASEAFTRGQTAIDTIMGAVSNPGESGGHVVVRAEVRRNLLRPLGARGRQQSSGPVSDMVGAAAVALAPDEQVVLLDGDGVVLAAPKHGPAAQLGITVGAALCDEVVGVSPVLQKLLLDAHHEAAFVARAAIRTKEGEGLLLRLRALPAEGHGHPVAISAEGRFDPWETPGEALLGLQDHFDIVSRVIAITSGDYTPKEATGEILRTISTRLRMDAAAFYSLLDYPSARLVSAFGRTRRRGVPYSAVDCTDPPVAALLGGAPVVMIRTTRTGLPAALADVCTPDAIEVFLLSAPTAGGISGFLVLSRDVIQPFEASSLHTMCLAARLLGLVTEHAQLSLESERSSVMLETAYAVSRTISRSLDLEHTFKVVAMNATRLLPGMRCVLFETNSAPDELVAVAASQTADVDLRGLRLRLDGRAVEQMMSCRHFQAELLDMIWGESMRPEVRRAVEARTALVLPMLANEELIGALVLLSPRRFRTFSDRDLELAEELADQAAAAIHNARLYSDLAASRQHVQALIGRMARIREHERRELASIVHDDVIQSVAGSVYKLEAVRDQLPAEAQEALSDAITVLQGAVMEARNVIADLRPPVLENLGLSVALRMLVDRMDTQGPARVGLEIKDLPDLGPAKAASVYRIVREALVNAQRHADARHVWVDLRCASDSEGGVLHVTVRDDGKGLEGQTVREGHYGVTMMEEQAALVGGNLDIVSLDGQGLTVRAVVPLEEASALTAEEGR